MSTTSGPPIEEVAMSKADVPKQSVPPQEKKNEVMGPIPTEGFPVVWYGIKRFFAAVLKFITFKKANITSKPPKLSKKEQAKLDEQEELRLQAALEQRRIDETTEMLASLISQLKRLAESDQRTIAVLNSKGGSGKTPVAAYLTTILMWVIKMQVIIVDANENRGTTTRRMGVHGQNTLTISQVINRMEELGDYSSVTSALAAHSETGALVVGSNPQDQGFTRYEYVKGMMNTFRSCHSAIQDCGNGNTWPANDGSAILATDLVFAALEYKPDSLVDLLTTMWVLKNDGHEQKVKNGWIVISATQPGQTVEQFVSELDRMAREDILPIDEIDESGVTRKRHLTLEEIGVSEKRIHLIPFDPYIAQDKIASAEAIGVNTLIAYLLLLVAIFQEGANYPMHEEQIRASKELFRPYATNSSIQPQFST